MDEAQRDERRLLAAAEDVALLAAVPEEHLQTGQQTCAIAGRVAFGSDDGMLFANLLHLLDGDLCRVLFYASHGKTGGPPRATWHGLFVGVTGAVNGSHPNPAIRPPSTASDGKWTIFWEVAELQPLPPDDTRLISSLRGNGKATSFSKLLIPQRPYIIEPY
jgi:hypothetical protein